MNLTNEELDALRADVIEYRPSVPGSVKDKMLAVIAQAKEANRIGPHNVELTIANRQLEDEVQQLRTQAAELRRDAERLTYLEEHIEMMLVWPVGQPLRTIIDAAMEAGT